MRVKLTVKGFEPLEAELKRLSQVRFDSVCRKNMTQVYNRGKAGGTPVDTGELRQSLSQAGDTVGYNKDYALRKCDAYKTGQKRRTLNLQTHLEYGQNVIIDLVILNAKIQRLNRPTLRQIDRGGTCKKGSERQALPLLLAMQMPMREYCRSPN